jgi:gluconate 2-dehydrogenase gamma chain
MNRRTAMALMGLGVAASRVRAVAQHMHAMKKQPARYKLQYFTPAQDRLLDHVAEMILPGAREARVSHYIDLIAANSPPEERARRDGQLAAFDRAGGRPFLELSAAGQAALLDRLAAAEANPRSPEEQFFAAMKRATIFAYYTSEAGLLKELGYQGNRVLSSFPGCR